MELINAINSVLLSGALMASHEGNHNRVANENDIPLDWEKSKFRFRFHEATPKQATDIGAAGFKGQDAVKLALEGSQQEKLYKFLNALHKASYVLNDRGDIVGISKNSGLSSDQVKALISATVLWDAVKEANPEELKNYDVSFDTLDVGAPGLKVTRRF